MALSYRSAFIRNLRELAMSFNGWRKVKLGDIADIVMGQSPESKYYNNAGLGLPFLQGNRTFGYKHPTYDTYCTSGNKFADPNDVLLSVRAPVGDLNVTKDRICIGRGLASLSMKNGNNEYLYYLLKANISELISRESGTVYGSVNRNDISDFEVKVVDSDEKQRRIAGILSALDDKIELNRQTNATLEAIAQAIFKEWFVNFNYPGATGELVESELGLIPSGWRVGKFGNLVIINSGKGLKREEFIETGYPVLGANGQLGYTGKYLLDEEAVLTGRVGTLGTFQIVNEKVWISDNVLIMRPNEKENYYFSYFWIRSIDFSNLNRGSTQPLVTKTDLLNLPLMIPDPYLLHLFDAFCRALFASIENNRKQTRTLAAIRDDLLPRFMNGEIEANKRNNGN